MNIELRDGAPHLDGRPLGDGAELELRLCADRWVPVRYRLDGSLTVALGGPWELRGETPPEATLRLELARAELRWTAPAQQVSRLARLREFMQEAMADAPPPEAPIELDVVRAHKQFRTQLPSVLADHQQAMRDRSFELLHAAAGYGALHQAGGAPDDPGVVRARADLESAAIRFETASRLLAALQLMDADEPR